MAAFLADYARMLVFRALRNFATTCRQSNGSDELTDFDLTRVLVEHMGEVSGVATAEECVTCMGAEEYERALTIKEVFVWYLTLEQRVEHTRCSRQGLRDGDGEGSEQDLQVSGVGTEGGNGDDDTFFLNMCLSCGATKDAAAFERVPQAFESSTENLQVPRAEKTAGVICNQCFLSEGVDSICVLCHGAFMSMEPDCCPSLDLAGQVFQHESLLSNTLTAAL
jgi:hypothetical protein